MSPRKIFKGKRTNKGIKRQAQKAATELVLGPAAVLCSDDSKTETAPETCCWVNALALNKTGDLLLTGDDDGTLRQYFLPRKLKGPAPCTQRKPWVLHASRRCLEPARNRPDWDTQPITAIEFLPPNERHAVVGYRKGHVYVVQLYPSLSVVSVFLVAQSSPIESLSMTTRGLLLLACAKGVEVYEPFSGVCLATCYDNQANHIALLPTGDFVSTSLGGDTILWDAGVSLALWSGLERGSGSLPHHPYQLGRESTYRETCCMTVLPLSMAVVSGHLSGHVTVSSLHGKALKLAWRSLMHTGAVISVAGARYDGLRQEIMTQGLRYLPTVLVSLILDYVVLDRLITGSADRTARSWDLSTGACQCVSPLLPGEVNSITLLPGGSLCVLALSNKTLWLWDCENNKFPARLEGHKQAVYRTRVAPSSEYLLSASDDVLVWDMRSFSVKCAARDCINRGSKCCARCSTLYCSRECQKAHWPVHKQSCRLTHKQTKG